jgi:hypothetical protein
MTNQFVTYDNSGNPKAHPEHINEFLNALNDKGAKEIGELFSTMDSPHASEVVRGLEIAHERGNPAGPRAKEVADQIKFHHPDLNRRRFEMNGVTVKSHAVDRYRRYESALASSTPA